MICFMSDIRYLRSRNLSILIRMTDQKILRISILIKFTRKGQRKDNNFHKRNLIDSIFLKKLVYLMSHNLIWNLRCQKIQIKTKNKISKASKFRNWSKFHQRLKWMLNWSNQNKNIKWCNNYLKITNLRSSRKYSWQIKEINPMKSTRFSKKWSSTKIHRQYHNQENYMTSIFNNRKS